MERDQGSDVDVGEDVPVENDERLVDPTEFGGEPDRTGRVERGRLDRVARTHPSDTPVRECLGECVGPVAEREDGVLDSVDGQLTEHPLDHGLLTDREHLLRRGQCERSEARPFAAHQDDGPHFGELVGVVGTDVAVGGTVTAVDPPVAALIRAVIAFAGGLGTEVLAGTNAMVTS